MITAVHVTLTPAAAPLQRRDLFMSSLHGLLFQTVLPAYDAAETTWLHAHSAPKPFALAPQFDDGGGLCGLRLAAWNGRTADLLLRGWEQALADGMSVSLGPAQYRVTAVQATPPLLFAPLLAAPPRRRIWLHFETPTAFAQGPLRLHLPLPVNVFDRPYRMWQTYAPPSLRLADGWPAWCAQHVMVSRHRIRTQRVQLNGHAPFDGFVGRAQFAAHDDDETALRVWRALARLAAYSGVGYKTTMGLGAVSCP